MLFDSRQGSGDHPPPDPVDIQQRPGRGEPQPGLSRRGRGPETHGFNITFFLGGEEVSF